MLNYYKIIYRIEGLITKTIIVNELEVQDVINRINKMNYELLEIELKH